MRNYFLFYLNANCSDSTNFKVKINTKESYIDNGAV